MDLNNLVEHVPQNSQHINFNLETVANALP